MNFKKLYCKVMGPKTACVCVKFYDFYYLFPGPPLGCGPAKKVKT